MFKMYRWILLQVALVLLGLLIASYMDILTPVTIEYIPWFIIFVVLVNSVIMFYNMWKEPLQNPVLKIIFFIMSIVSLIILSLFLIVVIYILIDISKPLTIQEKDAIIAAENWLVLVYKGESPEGWKEISERMGQKSVEVQATLSKVTSRKFNSIRETSLTHHQDGQYFNIVFKTSFEHHLKLFHIKDPMLESVTISLEKDGKWRVLYYFIKSPLSAYW